MEAVKIAHIDREETSYSGLFRYEIFLTDGRSASTIKEDLAMDAYRLFANDRPVWMNSTRQPRLGEVLTAIGATDHRWFDGPSDEERRGWWLR